MNGLPVDADLQPLAGAHVVQLCIGEHQLIVNFDIGARVSVESVCLYTRPGNEGILFEDYRTRATELCGLLGLTITAAERDPEGGMILVFDDGTKLHIQNSTQEFESFQVHIGEKIYVA